MNAMRGAVLCDAQVNDQAASAANTLGYTTLSTMYKRRLIDELGTIICNGQQALSTAFILGSGAPFSVMQAWANSYQASQLTVKYNAVSTQAGINAMAAGKRLAR
jgi:ABC-type phosphate transport system substrate-binding protein